MQSPLRSLALVSLACALATGAMNPAYWAPPDTPTSGTQALRSVGQGAAHLRSGELFLACYRFREAVDLAPDWAMARYELGQCLRLLGDPHGEAKAHLQRAITQQPGRHGFQLALGHLAEDLGDRPTARKAYTRASHLSPTDRSAQQGLARMGTKAEGQTALERLRREVARHPRDRAIRRLHAEIAASLGANVEAEESFRWLLQNSHDRCRTAAAMWAFGVSSRSRSTINDAVSACK
ncbi:MAG: tetratricopeptide repeat protein [Myxococcota bacterium]|nr:tetratricopeptide repeat protein [Myxococcota bacterium]